MKTKNILYSVLALVIVILIAIGASNGLGAVGNGSGSNKAPIKIGAILSETGVAADFGEAAHKSIDLAVEEINSKGGIKGRMVEVIFEDDQTDPKTAQSAYEKLVNIDKVDALIGGLFDFTAQPIFPRLLRDKITFISPVNFVIPKTFEMNEYSFVMYPLFSDVVAELDKTIADNGIKKLGMIRFESGFSESIQNTLKDVMKNQGGTLVVDTYKAIGSSDFRTNISKMKKENPDAIFLDMLDFDIVKYLKDSSVLGLNKQIIGYTTLRDVINSKDIDKTKLEGAIMLDWEISSPEFIKRFTEKYGEIPRHGGGESYDAIYVLSEAIANTQSREQVSKYLETHDFKTINKTVSFTAEHGAKNIPVKVYKIQSGKFVEVDSN